MNAVDQAPARRLFRAETPAGHCQFGNDTRCNQLGQTLQCADICGHANIDLLDRELGINRSKSHVASCHQIDAATNARTLDSRNNR